MKNEEGEGKDGVGRKGSGARRAATGFYPPPGARAPGLAPCGPPSGPRLPRAARRAAGRARAAGPAPGAPRTRSAGARAWPRAASHRPGFRRVPPGRAFSEAIRPPPKGGATRGGGAWRGQVTSGERERRRLVAILGGGRLKAGECEGAAGKEMRGEGPAPHDPHPEAESRAAPTIVP